MFPFGRDNASGPQVIEHGFVPGAGVLAHIERNMRARLRQMLGAETVALDVRFVGNSLENLFKPTERIG